MLYILHFVCVCVELGNKIEGAYKMVKLSSSLVKGMEVVFCIIAEEIVELIRVPTYNNKGEFQVHN